jgi:hypothetical protein
MNYRRNLLPVSAAVVAIVVSTVLALTADPAEAKRRATVQITSICPSLVDGWDTIRFSAHRGHDPVMDDGTARLLVLDVTSRSHGGQWRTFRMFGDDGIPSADDLLRSGGEGTLRFDRRRYAQEGGLAILYRVGFKGGVSRKAVIREMPGTCEPAVPVMVDPRIR